MFRCRMGLCSCLGTQASFLLHHHSGLLHAGSQFRQFFLDELDYQAVQPVSAVLLHIVGRFQASGSRAFLDIDIALAVVLPVGSVLSLAVFVLASLLLSVVTGLPTGIMAGLPQAVRAKSDARVRMII